jgi:hypothetical protein
VDHRIRCSTGRRHTLVLGCRCAPFEGTREGTSWSVMAQLTPLTVPKWSHPKRLDTRGVAVSAGVVACGVVAEGEVSDGQRGAHVRRKQHSWKSQRGRWGDPILPFESAHRRVTLIKRAGRRARHATLSKCSVGTRVRRDRGRPFASMGRERRARRHRQFWPCDRYQFLNTGIKRLW